MTWRSDDRGRRRTVNRLAQRATPITQSPNRQTAKWLLLLTLLLSACAAPPRTTRLTVDDMQEMTAAMAQSLTQSAPLAERGPDSPRWVVSIDKVLNLSSDVMTESEQWSIMHDLRASVPLTALWDTKNVRFVLPPERVRAMREDPDAPGEFDQPDFGAEREPTHSLIATFHSVTRAQAEDRSDLYYAEFQMVDLATGETVWSDKFEFKRVARGHVWD